MNSMNELQGGRRINAAEYVLNNAMCRVLKELQGGRRINAAEYGEKGAGEEEDDDASMRPPH